MSYVGVIASAVLHVGGLFLLLSARAPDPLVPLGADTPLDVSIISEEEYAALTSRAPERSTLDALRVQPATPDLPTFDAAIPDVDTSSDTETPPPEPEPVELAMRPPAPVADALPPVEPEEPPQPDSSEVERAPAPAPLAVPPEAMQDRQVNPADLIPQDDVAVATAPPAAPKPPRGVMDTLPEIDLSADEPPEPAETEGESEVAEEQAPAPEPQPEEVETAQADDPAPLATPLPVMKPRGSLAVASTEEETPPVPAPAEVAEIAAPVPAPPAPEPAPEPAVDPVLGLTAAELEEERRMMEAIQEQMRANRPPTEEEIRAAEAEALAKLAEEQERARELAALDEAERRAREEADRAAQAEAERLAAEAAAAAAEREARALADLRARQQAMAEAERLRQEAIRQAQIEAQRQAQAELERRQREEQARIEEQRQREIRRQQLAALNGAVSPEDTARAVLSAPAPTGQPAPSATDDRLASILGAADAFANRASTGPAFSQGGGARQGTSLTPGETQAVLDQLRACWRVDTFSANARSQVVTLQAQIRQNGFVNQATIQVVSPRPAPPEYRIAVERAVAALQDRRCQPFALPPQKYSAWRDIVIRFDPAQMVLQ